MVGNVGVLGVAPEYHTPSEINVETGPFKVTGFSQLLFPLNISNALENFAGAVELSRGDRLNLSPSTLRLGMIYIGTEAVSAGLADDIGSLQKAAQYAAEEAGLDAYNVVDIISDGFTTGLSAFTENITRIPWREMTLETLNTLNPPPAIYYLYLPVTAYGFRNEFTISDGDLNGETLPETKKGSVIVDLSHGNKIPTEVFQLLSAELAMRGVLSGYADTWDEVESSLPSAACLIVAAPTKPYTAEEFQAVKEFVSSGRLLLLFYDPATEFNAPTSSVWPINSLANRWGLAYSRGYLYNEKEHYGLYRNIYVGNFENTTFTKNLERLVFFTSTHLHPTDSDAAYTSRDTHSSISERAGWYAPIAVIEKGNGTTAAFGDMTFLIEPYVYLEDNYDLVMNIVFKIAEIEVPIIEPEPEEPEHNITEPDLPPGTVKVYKEVVDGEERDVLWTKSSETQIWVERPDRITEYRLDEENKLLGWMSNGMEMTYDDPVPDFPYPLTENKGWVYRVGYNLTLENETYRGLLEHHGQVVDFEFVKAANNQSYWCAKVSVVETDELNRVVDTLTIDSIDLLWISYEAGLVKVESDVSYSIDGTLALVESRSMIMVKIEKGGG
jgi:hypothetical protein